jgi:hypothetical protein
MQLNTNTGVMIVWRGPLLADVFGGKKRLVLEPPAGRLVALRYSRLVTVLLAYSRVSGPNVGD